MSLESQGAHGTMRFGTAGIYHSNLGAGAELNYRFALHDLLDLQVDYPGYTQLDMGSVRLQYFPGNKTFLFDELTIVKILRLPVLTAQWDQLSWSVEVGGRSLRESFCSYCGVGSASGGIGATVQPTSLPVDLWMLVEAEIIASPAFTGFFIKPSLGPRAGIRLRLTPELNALVSAAYRYRFTSPITTVWEGRAHVRWAFARNWALDGRCSWEQDGLSVSAGIALYD